MNIEYFVYFRQEDPTPILSIDELPPFQLRVKQKYVGKKAKIEAIFRLSNTALGLMSTTKQVNDYIAKNIFNTPLWSKYHEIFQVVSNEKEVVSDKYEMKYTLIVEVETPITNIRDERLIHLLTCELLGQPLDEFKGLKNQIISLKKKY